MSWDHVGRYFGTDKSSDGHGYLDAYERCLELRDVRDLLEIGVDTGASLRMWSDVLPDATITGIDVQPGCMAHEDQDIRVVIADAADPVLMALELRDQTFDVIVDDGSHRLQDIVAAARFLVPRLRPGGLYAIEDTIEHPKGSWPAPLTDVLDALPELGLRCVQVVRSQLDFVAGNEFRGIFAMVLAEHA